MMKKTRKPLPTSFKLLMKNRKTVVYAMIGQALEEKEESEDNNNNDDSKGGKKS